MDSIPSNSDNMRTVKHLSENQKQKVQHQEKLLETVRQTIKETDPPQKGNRSNTDKTKNSKRQL